MKAHPVHTANDRFTVATVLIHKPEVTANIKSRQQMKLRPGSSLICLIVLVIMTSTIANTLAQGTAFTYQGRLSDGGAPANGNYDLRFTIYNAATNGNVV